MHGTTSVVCTTDGTPLMEQLYCEIADLILELTKNKIGKKYTVIVAMKNPDSYR